MRLRTVTDTNIIIAGLKSPGEKSPNKKYIELWLNDKFDFLYSDDTQNEYSDHILVFLKIANCSVFDDLKFFNH
jgi:predicted nucleic acid-binding protein